MIQLFCSQPKIQGSNRIVGETTLYNFDSLSVLAMDCHSEVVTSFL